MTTTHGWLRRYGISAAALAVVAVLASAAEAKTFRWANDGDPTTMDPHARSDLFVTSFDMNMYEPLVRRDRNLKLEGALATEWSNINPTTWRFKLRQGVKFHDGSPLTADDVVASWNKIIDPPEGVSSARQSHFVMVDKVEAPDPIAVLFRLKFATDAFLPALAGPYNWIYQKIHLDRDPRWYEKNILGSGPFKFAGIETGQSIKGCAIPTTITRVCLISTASSASMPTSRRPGWRRCAATALLSSSAAFRRRCATSWSARSATGSPCRKAIGIVAA